MITDQDSPLTAGSIPFLIADRAQVLPMLRFSVDKKLSNSNFRTTLERAVATNQAASAVVEPTGPKSQVRALGTLQITVGDRVLSRNDWSNRFVKELFLLVLHRLEGLTKEQLVGTLWKHEPVVQGTIGFRHAAYRLRHLIPESLAYGDGLYRLAHGVNIEYDVMQFTRWVRHAEETCNEKGRVEKHEASIALYSGDILLMRNCGNRTRGKPWSCCTASTHQRKPMSTKQIDPTAEEFCRIVAQMIVETARNGVNSVVHKISKKSKKTTPGRK